MSRQAIDAIFDALSDSDFLKVVADSMREGVPEGEQSHESDTIRSMAARLEEMATRVDGTRDAAWQKKWAAAMDIAAAHCIRVGELEAYAKHRDECYACGHGPANELLLCTVGASLRRDAEQEPI